MKAAILAAVVLGVAQASPLAWAHGDACPALLAAGGFWPDAEQVLRVVTMRDYNMRIVLLGTALLGVSAGVVGTFTLLRRRALVGDVVSHAALPGIAVAFLVIESFEPGAGKSLGGLLAGAAVAGLAAVLLTVAVRRTTRIKEDATMAIVLSVFFGLGIALFTVVQALPTGNAAGLHHFIYGKAASMVAADVWFIAKAAAVVLVICVLLFKEFAVVCFDQEYAAAQGWPVGALDVVLMGLVVGVTVIGLQSVGLLLVVALLIIPAAAARFWTEHLPTMTVASGLLGGASALVGVLASALFPRLAAGAVIVLAGSAMFVVSMLVGARRGVLLRVLEHRRTQRRVGKLDLLRALYECVEPAGIDETAATADAPVPPPVALDDLAAKRSWSAGRLRRLLHREARQGLVRPSPSGGWQLTAEGLRQARRVARNHRLWELYLITHADVAPSHVDRDADLIEHVLEPGIVEELEALLSEQYPHMAVPPSPHEIEEAASTP